MIVEVVTKIDQFRALEEEWNCLFQIAENVTFFQTFKYNMIAWETFSTSNDKLYIITYRAENKELLAVFPFYIDKKGFLKFINDVHTDFCNILVSENVVSQYNLMNDVWKHINEDTTIKFLMFDNVLQTSPILSYWKVFSRNAFVFSQTEHSWLNCHKSDNILGEFKHLSVKKRKYLLYLERKSAHCTMEIFHKKSHEYPERQVDKLIQTMELKGLRSSSYLNEKMIRFMKSLYDHALVEIPIIFENGEPVSLGFRFVNETNDFFMTWVILYKDKHYNLWINSKYIVEKAKQKNVVIDFGRGGYDYKMSNFHPNVENLYQMMFSKSKLGNWYILFRMTTFHLRKTIKKYR